VIAQAPGQRPARGPAPAPPGDAEPFDLVAAFEDMGDDAAQQQGIGHTPDGFVSYAQR
jgi:hypothetical protein